MSRVDVHVLGQFEIRLPDGRVAGPWERPMARRLVQLLAVRPHHRMMREALQESFFAGLPPERSANAVSKALTMVRRATSPYDVVRADRGSVWLEEGVVVDADLVRARLVAALGLTPGDERDRALVAALDDQDVLLEDEFYVDWAREERDRLDALRAEARRALARDRTAGFGQSDLDATAHAWRDVFNHEPADEEACLGLIRCESSAGHPLRAVQTFERTRVALEDLGLTPSSALVEGVHDMLGASPLPMSAPTAPAEPTVQRIRATLEAATRARRVADKAARSLFTEAIENVGGLSPAERAQLRSVAGDAHVQLGELLRDNDELDAAEIQFRHALDIAESDAELARAWSALGSIPYRLGNMTLAIELYGRGRAALRGDDPVADLRLTIDTAFALGRAGHGDEALTRLETACADLEEIDDPALVGRAFDHLAVHQSAAGRHEQSLATMQRAFAAIGVLRDEHALAPLHIHRAAILRDLGRFGEGLADTAAAIRIATATNDAYALSVAHWVAANLREDIGDMEGALADRDAELALLHELGNQRNTAGAEAARARILSFLGRTDQARRAADHARAAAESCRDEALVAAIDRDLPALDPASDQGKSSGTARAHPPSHTTM